MEFIYSEIINIPENIFNLPFGYSNGPFLSYLEDEHYSNNIYTIEKDCDFVVGFYSDTSCDFELIIGDTIFKYILKENTFFYALDNKFIIPYLKLENQVIQIRNINGIKDNICIVKYNTYSDIRKNIMSRLLYCKLNTNIYLIYDRGSCFINTFLKLDRSTSLFQEIKNMKVYAYIRNEHAYTYLEYYIEREPKIFYNKRRSNFFGALWILLFGE